MLEHRRARLVRAGREDWLEAFRAHPKIGESKAAARDGRGGAALVGGRAVGRARGGRRDARRARRGQPRVRGALRPHLHRLRHGQDRRRRCSRLLRARMPNDPETELRVAADEQWRITRASAQETPERHEQHHHTRPRHLAWTPGGGRPRHARNAVQRAQLAFARPRRDGRRRAAARPAAPGLSVDRGRLPSHLRRGRLPVGARASKGSTRRSSSLSSSATRRRTTTCRCSSVRTATPPTAGAKE